MTRIPDDAPVYSMAIAERMTGLTRRRIRYYEAAGLLEPARTPGNRRLYSPSDIRRLSDIKRMLAEGLDLRAIVALASSGRWPGGGPGQGRPGEPPYPPRPFELPGLGPYEDARARLLGRGPAGSVDRLYPGDAGRLVRGQPAKPGPGKPGPGKPGTASGSPGPSRP